MQVKLNDKNEYLVANIKHINGRYVFFIRKEFEKDYGNGVVMREFTPFADGNGKFTLFEGRKSSKKLEKLNNLLETNKKIITDFWTNGNYGNLVYYVDSLVKTMSK